MNFLATIILTSVIILSSSDDDCKKVKNPKPVNSWMSVVLAETYSIKVLQGRVIDSNDKPISKALIEIVKISKGGKGKIIYVCQTQESGRFHFKKLKEGKYEVRVSLVGHDRTSVMVSVSKESFSKEEIVIPLKVSN